MTEDQLNEIKASLVSVVKQTVNGKIDALSATVHNHIEADMLWKDQNDTKWKDAQPIINAGRNLSGWGKVTAAILVSLAGIVGIITGIMKIFKLK